MFYVHIPASKRNGTLYIGMTNDLARRVYEHREGAIPGFTRRYGVKRLVWFELHDTATLAMQREKSLKRWNRGWKLAPIEKTNPDWDDLHETLSP
jgi:putative endonuclease